ncbi:YybH family protein [Duganella rhizosphaerae]|uniref:YybH family protein n=1 Tax=Duganella rhizosphaerae TaxID=2885763 RepID=UPI000A7B3A6C
MKWANLAVAGVLALATAAAGAAPVFTGVQEQVANVERAFAATMKARDHAAFMAFLSDEAVFSGSTRSLHGKQAVADEWKKFFDKPNAPFSWEPDEVEVLASGTLAKTSGPVHGPDGKLIARFSSVWRLEAPNTWRIVFDGGVEVCGNK